MVPSNYPKDPFVNKIISDLHERFPEIVIAIFGIGSYFDFELPPNWRRNDIDLVLIVKSLESIQRQDWTSIRYEKKKINNKELWIGFNTISGLTNKEQFAKESFSNYEWSLLELKLPENSTLLYGQDIRNELPSIDDLKFDLDDIFARGLYHLEKSFTEKDVKKAKQEFTKSVFKFAFYYCIFQESQFRSTSLTKIILKLKQIISDYSLEANLLKIIEYCVLYRLTGDFPEDFNKIRKNYISLLFQLLQNGDLHKKMGDNEVIMYLNSFYSGFPNLVQRFKQYLQESSEKAQEIDDEDVIEPSNLIYKIESEKDSIDIEGEVGEIFRGTVFKRKRDNGSKGKVVSFILRDFTGVIRVVLWDRHTQILNDSKFGRGTIVSIQNGFSREGQTGALELHVAKYGEIKILNAAKTPFRRRKKKILKPDVEKILIRLGIRDTKSVRSPCPYCGTLYPSSVKFCKKCGEFLSKPE